MLIECVDPRRTIGQLIQRRHPAVVGEADHMVERRIELLAGPAGLAPVAARDQQAAIVERVEFIGLGLNVVMATELPPHLTAHRRGAHVLTSNPQRQTLSGVADEIRMQQRPERLPVTGGQRTVKAPNGSDLRGVGRRGVRRRHGRAADVFVHCVQMVHEHAPFHRMSSSTRLLFNLDSAAFLQLSDFQLAG